MVGCFRLDGLRLGCFRLGCFRLDGLRLGCFKLGCFRLAGLRLGVLGWVVSDLFEVRLF